MAAYTQFGYGSYPSANQLLGGNVNQNSTSILSHNAPSPLSGLNENSLSPSGGSSSPSSSVASSSGTINGPLSPGAMSQTSTRNAGGVAALNTTASSLTNSLVNGSLVDTSVSAAEAAVAAASTSNHSTTGAGSVAGGGGCCENGRPIMTDPVSGQTVCSCQYDSARLALSNYSRMPTAGVGVYGTAYPSNDQNPYPSIGVDSSAFYTPLTNPYALKESTTGSEMTAWSTAGLQPTTGYYSYDPTFAYGYSATYDLASRRKNATRESTATLKAWLNEHKKNPYPTKGEKIMLAIITKMTLTQVSTWFANARRRLKKENKMTWEPKNRTEDDDDDAMLSDDEKELDKTDMHKVAGGNMYGQQMQKEHEQLKTDQHLSGKLNDLKEDEDDRKPENLTAIRQLENYNTASLYGVGGGGGHHSNAYHPYQNPQQQQQPQHQQQQSMYYQQQQQLLQQGGAGGGGGYVTNPATIRDECGIPIPATKPKIWSVADTAANKTPPPTQAAYMSNSQQQQLAAQSYYANNLQINNHLTATNSPLSMMSNYVNATTPYSRLSAGYPATANYAAQMNTTSTNSSSVNMMHMPQQYTTAQNLHSQQLQLQQQQQQQHQQQGRLGFPEIQPDTPPQTPPNMKHANNMNTLMGNTSSSSSSSSSMAYAGTTNTTNVLNTSYGSDVSSVASRVGLEMQ